MKVKEIKHACQCVISTGSYENQREFFEIGATMEDGDDLETSMATLEQFNHSRMRLAVDKAIVERIESERKDFRFLPSPTTGKLLPSVTSIINYDADFFQSAEDLRQFCAQGIVMDAQVKHYVKTGKWVEPKEISDIWTELVILNRGKLKLSSDCGDFRGFLSKYTIEGLKVAQRLFNDELGVTGEPDLLGLPKFKGAEEIDTVFDIKRTADKIKNGMQLSVYCKMMGYKQGIIIPCNNKTEQRFSKPIVYNEKQLAGYFKMFLKKQEEFIKRYM